MKRVAAAFIVQRAGHAHRGGSHPSKPIPDFHPNAPKPALGTPGLLGTPDCGARPVHKLLICQRTKYQSMPLKWEFPGGKIEAGEQPRDALRRELEEELGIIANIGDEVSRIRHTYRKGGTVELRFFMVEEFTGEIENRIFKDVRWVARQELPEFDFLEADAELVTDIAAGKIL